MIAFRISFLLLAMSAGAMADVCGEKSEKYQWFGQCKGGEQGSEEFSEASTCSCKNGKMHGRGWYREPGMRLYSGDMQDGLFSGMGWLRTKSGYITYKGNYAAGNQSGTGMLKLPVSTVYSTFTDNRPGDLVWSIDSVENVYAGQYSNGKRSGYGVMDFHGLATYYGEWKDGKRVGCGVLERGDSIEAQVYTLLLGKVREGTWVLCNRTRECRTGVYCRCDEDDVRLLQQKVETYRECVDAAKAKAIQYSELARQLKETIVKDIEAVEWPGANAEFGNVTDPGLLAQKAAAAQKASSSRRRENREDGDDEDADEDLGASLMTDIVVFTSLLSLFQFLKKMFEDDPIKVRVLWALLGCGLVALYEKSVGWSVTFEALYLTYRVFTEQYDDEVEGHYNAHGEL